MSQAGAGPGAHRAHGSAAGFIAPGATLGVLGGGQLGRMFVHAAQQLGYRTAVLEPDASSPAAQLAHEHVCTRYDDADGLARLAKGCAAITTEFENVPATTLAALASKRPVAPSASAVAICQDRAAEKAAFKRAGVACAPHALIAAAADAARVDASLFPALLKTSRFGYDGKGQRHVATQPALADALDAFGGAACVIEKRLSLAGEISVIVARGRDGEVVHLPPQENVHRDGILAITRVPAVAASAAQQREAVALAIRMAEFLDYVGVLCVEFFLLEDGALIANEMAPRPHNSGHYSIDACDVSQFELQVRTLVGAPLCAPRLHSPCVMLNLLGDLWFGEASAEAVEPPWQRLLALAGVHLHLYGKAEPRRGRKMGHVTITAPSADEAERVARAAAECLGLAFD